MNFDLSFFHNLDLLSVGVTVAGIGILGFVVFLNNTKSITNKTFLLVSISAILWSVSNYLSYQFSNPEIVIWLIRLHVFFAVWYVFFLFQLFFIFPEEDFKFSKKYKYFLIPSVALCSLFTLTSLVFLKPVYFSSTGQLLRVTSGPALIFFAGTTIILSLSGVIILIRKAMKATGLEKKQSVSLLVGAVITLSLHIIFSLIFPAFLHNTKYIPLGSIFIFPFIAFSSYAIFKHRLLKIKIVAAEIFVFVMSAISLAELILVNDSKIVILSSAVFILVLISGILLIRSVIIEVKQREEIQSLLYYKETLERLMKEEKKNTELLDKIAARQDI